MNLTRNERKELDALSKEVFGSSSRWQKLCTHGYDEIVTEKVTETVPATEEGKEPTTNTVDKPVQVGNNAYKAVTKFHTVESVKEYMLEQKKRLDSIREMIKKQQEEEKARKEAEHRAQLVHEATSGSAKV